MGTNPNSLIKGGFREQRITSKDAIYKSEICSHITLPNSNESFRVYSFDVRSRNKEAKNLAYLYVACQRQLLKQEIKEETNIIWKQKKEFNSLKMTIKSKVSIIDFSHISCLFVVGNDKKILNVREFHRKNLKGLGMVAGLKSHDPDKIIANYSSYNLSDNEKKLLIKGLNFAFPPRKLNYADYLAPYELLFRDVKNLSVQDNILERLKLI